MQKFILSFGVLLLASVAMSGQALACSCAPEAPIEEKFAGATAVFHGKVLKRETIDPRPGVKGDEYYIYTMLVKKAYKGDLDRVVYLKTEAFTFRCGVWLEKNTEYLIWAYDMSLSSFKKVSLTTSSCARNKPIDAAVDELLWLEENQ